MTVEWVLEPYVGFGPIRFGLTPDEVAGLVGPPVRVVRNRRGERDEFRDLVRVGYSRDDERVVEVGLLPPIRALYRGLNLFSDPEVLNVLGADDPEPMEYLGFLVFFKLGLTLTGIHDGDASQRAVTGFVRGRWDPLRGEMRPRSLRADL